MQVTLEDIKKLIEENLMSWERMALAESLCTKKELLTECTIDEIEDMTGFYVFDEKPEEKKIRDFDTWELVDELKRRHDPDYLLDEFDRKDIAGYMLSHFSDFEDEPELCRRIVRFVLRDELKDYIKREGEV